MRANQQTGFSLLSIILSIILISFALMTLTILLFPRAEDSVKLIHSTKASELGAAVMDEIIGRKYDENSGPNGGIPECNSQSGKICSLAKTKVINGIPQCDDSLGKTCLGPDPDEIINGVPDRALFNDVDDFDGLSGSVKNVLGDDLGDIYPNFSISISVFYDANLDAIPDKVSGNSKRIVVDVIDPSGQHYLFSVIRGNF
ncbi:type II secretion system protein [Aliivibrio sp. SR45-2]|uniref:type II secretion system protein n=1 Tax=Aliivibrio sp. SR45-2 TaxID=2760931 RepID=UPI0015FD0C89|nr:type II secretion system protein [Aliivibrio sp. SR45-2]MBB1312057.1 type II secretion system protein [Aliivibrio sp. SR45-2]